MVDIGRDGTITAQKLEGSQIRFRAKNSHFMASEILSLNFMKLTRASEEAGRYAHTSCGHSTYEWIMVNGEASPVMRNPRGSLLYIEYQSEARKHWRTFSAPT